MIIPFFVHSTIILQYISLHRNHLSKIFFSKIDRGKSSIARSLWMNTIRVTRLEK